jgi:aspartyl-tRNA(Asn)/glutamyl-tRNA(Gln) amidotransferase subunit A
MSDEIIWMSANELLDAYGGKKLSPVEATRVVLERIDSVNPKINAVVTLTADLAMEQAKAAEAAYMEGRARPLEGVPVTIKDNIVTKGIRTTCCSLMFEDYVPDEDAVLVERLRDAGVVILGKTNLPEYGLVAITDNLPFGPTLNPWDFSKTVGGSSGGAAASVVSGFGPLAVGNDAGGSIRIPSSLCGAFGLKPHFGRVPSYPHVVHGWETLNHEGPITRSVADAALMLNVMAGPDERDRSSLPASGVDFLSGLGDGLEGLRVAYTSDLSVPAVDPEVVEITKRAAFALAELGCEVSEDDPGIFDMSQDLITVVIAETAEAHASHLEEAKEKMYPLYKPFIDLADVFKATDFARVQFHREELWEKLWPFFSKYDLLLTPTTACAAFDLKEGGSLGPDEINGVEQTPSSWVGFTYPFNFSGQPAASVPCGFTAAGLPVGLQVVGRRYDEPTVLRAAAVFEKAIPWADRHPDF